MLSVQRLLVYKHDIHKCLEFVQPGRKEKKKKVPSYLAKQRRDKLKSHILLSSYTAKTKLAGLI